MPLQISRQTQAGLASILALLGVAMTTQGAANHGGPLVAPGATFLVLGGAWLGNALARLDVRLFGPEDEGTAEESGSS